MGTLKQFAWLIVLLSLVQSCSYFRNSADDNALKTKNNSKPPVSSPNIPTDYSQIQIELQVYNSENVLKGFPSLKHQSFYIPAFGIVNYIRFDDHCRGACHVNYVPTQSQMTALSYLTILKLAPSLNADQYIMNYIEHDSFVHTSMMRKRDVMAYTEDIKNKRGTANQISSVQVDYLKNKYPSFRLIEEQNLGFTTSNGVGDEMRKHINIPVKIFKQVEGSVVAAYVPDMFSVFVINMPLMSGDPLNSIPLLVHTEMGLQLYSKMYDKTNIPLMTIINSSGGEGAVYSLRDDFTSENIRDGNKVIFFKNGIEYKKPPRDNEK